MATVFLSIRKAEKLASKVSPIEALKTADVTISKRKQKYGQKIRLWKIAGENVVRNRKKFFLVAMSLSLSLIILNGKHKQTKKDHYTLGKRQTY